MARPAQARACSAGLAMKNMGNGVTLIGGGSLATSIIPTVQFSVDACALCLH